MLNIILYTVLYTYCVCIMYVHIIIEFVDFDRKLDSYLTPTTFWIHAQSTHLSIECM